MLTVYNRGGNLLKLTPLAPGRCDSNYKSVISKYMSQINFMKTSCIIGLKWMPQNPFDDKSALLQVMAWCHQATWTNVDPDLFYHMASLGHNELTHDDL